MRNGNGSWFLSRGILHPLVCDIQIALFFNLDKKDPERGAVTEVNSQSWQISCTFFFFTYPTQTFIYINCEFGITQGKMCCRKISHWLNGFICCFQISHWLNEFICCFLTVLYVKWRTSILCSPFLLPLCHPHSTLFEWAISPIVTSQTHTQKEMKNTPVYQINSFLGESCDHFNYPNSPPFSWKHPVTYTGRKPLPDPYWLIEWSFIFFYLWYPCHFQ